MPFIPPSIVIGFVIGAIGEVLLVVGVGTTQWMTLRNQRVDVDIGLFRECSNDICIDSSKDAPDVDALKAARGLAILGLIFGFIAIVIQIIILLLILTSKPLMRVFPLGLVAACFLSGAMTLIAVAVYAVRVYKKTVDDYHLDDLDLGYSFGLSVASLVLIPVGGLLAFAGTKSVAITGEMRSLLH